MAIVTVGIDLAKNVFAVHGVDETGKPALVRPEVTRAKLLQLIANLPPCLIGMEACSGAHHWSREFAKFGHTVRMMAPKFVAPYRMSGKRSKNDAADAAAMEACGSAHYWARKLQEFGHTVKLMAPQFVKPYVKTNKNDAADAEAICEAVTRPNMRFVPVKNIEQQAALALHCVRQGFVKARTAQANQIRGLLGEFGLIVPQGIGYIASRVPELIEDASNELPGSFRLLVQRLLDHLKELDRQVDELESQIVKWHRQSEASTKLAKVPGIGPITASALVASIGDAKSFDNGRQVAAWLGLVPKQHSSGGKQNLLGISKRGDTYLRTMLIHGARAVVYWADKKPDTCSWVKGIVSRRNKNVAAVALANKNARIVWALLAHEREFRPDYTTAKAAT